MFRCIDHLPSPSWLSLFIIFFFCNFHFREEESRAASVRQRILFLFVFSFYPFRFLEQEFFFYFENYWTILRSDRILSLSLHFGSLFCAQVLSYKTIVFVLFLMPMNIYHTVRVPEFLCPPYFESPI